MQATFGTGNTPDDTFVYLKQIDETVASAISSRFDPNEVLQFEINAHSHNLWHLPIPFVPELAPVDVNVLRWPSDASRFATFFALVTDDDLATISPVCWDNTGPLANYLMFTPDSDTETEGVTATMYALPPRPLTQIDGAVGLWLMPLVDQRYFWWMVSADFPLASSFTGYVSYATNATPIVLTVNNHGLTTGTIVIVSGVGGNTAANGNWSITVINANEFSLNLSVGNGNYTSGGIISNGGASSWTSLILLIGAALGVNITTSAIISAYGDPLGRFAVYRQPVNLYLDSVARTLGMRVVVGYDGSVSMQNWTDANDSQTTDENLIASTTTRPGRSGGYFNNTLIEQVIPSAVDVAFLRTEGSGQYGEAPYVISTSLASLTLTQYGSAVGYYGAKTLFGNLNAIYPGTITLTLGTQSSGTFTLSFTDNTGNKQTTSTLDYNCNDTDIQDALVALSNIGAGNATVTGSGPFSISLADDLPGSSNGLTAAFGLLTTPANASIVNGPSNITALTDYAVQAATDWYLYQLQDADLQFNGVVDWVPNGITDMIEIWITRDRCTTRISRHAYNELTWGCIQDLGFYPQAGPLTVEDNQSSQNLVNNVTILQITTPDGTGVTVSELSTGEAQALINDASATNSGVVNKTTQTFAGAKTFNSTVTVTEPTLQCGGQVIAGQNISQSFAPGGTPGPTGIPTGGEVALLDTRTSNYPYFLLNGLSNLGSLFLSFQLPFGPSVRSDSPNIALVDYLGEQVMINPGNGFYQNSPSGGFSASFGTYNTTIGGTFNLTAESGVGNTNQIGGIAKTAGDGMGDTSNHPYFYVANTASGMLKGTWGTNLLGDNISGGLVTSIGAGGYTGTLGG